MNPIALTPADALIIVDLQNDFLPGGALGVPQGDEVVAPIQQLIDLYQSHGLPIYASRDWHPVGHCSFTQQGGPWPIHCIAGSGGAAFAAAIPIEQFALVISKATTVEKDAYSAFNGTGLGEQMRARGIARVAVCGLATDYCVLNTARDALAEGFAALLVVDAIRAVEVHPGDGERAIAAMLAAGAQPVHVDQVGLCAETAEL
ncbi:isochorismatase family protein [Massilia sp. S19_KUP03_FR1]|uniref:isochorismatase family protein n=1 Tax=Massilia sp. S19_KUP03_FR1 TaxID=3025503 RepID=UPI002FCDE0A1